MYFLIVFFFFLWMPPIFNGLTQLNQDLINWADSAHFTENLRIYSNDLAVCLDSNMQYYQDGQQFRKELQAILDISKVNPVKAILSILQCMPKCETLTMNHYNILFQCLAQQQDNTKCCVDQMDKLIISLSGGSKEMIEKMRETWFMPKGAFWKLPLGALNREYVLYQLLPKSYERLDRGMTQEQYNKLKSETIAQIGLEAKFNPKQCIKLCNAEFPINPWYYFPLIRSGVCEAMYKPISYCLVPFGVIKERTEREQYLPNKGMN